MFLQHYSCIILKGIRVHYAEPIAVQNIISSYASINIGNNLTGKWWEDLDWTAVTQDRDNWPVVVKMVMNFQAPKYLCNCFTS